MCALQDVVASPGLRVSSDFTITRPPESNHLPKPLNQRDFVAPGTHLAPIGDKDARMTQPRLSTPMKSILDHSFRYTRSIDTDLRKTFARIRREQRQQARAQVEGENPMKVFLIRQRKPAIAS
jgi:hypothetical protein